MTAPTRKARIESACGSAFDIAIVGGGIHGACLAREASLHGFRVLLLEQRDYAWATSSRSSKLAHGGVRYLEQGEFALVSEALGERDILFKTAPHLVRPMKWCFPIIPGATRPAWQIGFGLKAYDLLARFSSRTEKFEASAFSESQKLSRGSHTAKSLGHLGLEFEEIYEYSDGQIEDTRLVIENILDASALGATCLNYARVTSISKSSEHWEIQWEDQVLEKQLTSRARYLVNAAGPFAPEVQALHSHWPEDQPQARFSRGVHLLFDIELPIDCLILPTGIPGRVYFVLPYFSPFGRGTLVGTTDREVPGNEFDPEANESEIEELLGFLKRDLPQAGLDRSRLFRVFCGMRILLPTKHRWWSPKRLRTSAQIGRKELFLKTPFSLAILGGKYTTARSVAEKAMREILTDLETPKRQLSEVSSTRSRPLPGAQGTSTPESVRSAELMATLQSLYPDLDSERAKLLSLISVRRYGNRASLLSKNLLELFPSTKSNCSPAFSPLEVALSLLEEQAESAEDVVLRRLCLWGVPGDLAKAVASVSAEFGIPERIKS